MQGILSAELEKFYAQIRARALLIAVDWAGSSDHLGRMTGLDRQAGQKWTQRGRIAPLAALSLSRVIGFPLTFEEMCPGFDVRTLTGLCCSRCGFAIKRPGRPTESSPILTARSEASARKLAASDAAVSRYRKRQAQRAARRHPPKP